ncbi:putative family-like transposase [Streptomyces viridochromogenes Tue57]|uniref:Putative family-like transposase n=1 Tax=Streptomyces viridochromogenes Tue57 TaxID=1160705 RepID=L8PJM3_STRVR|nr:putative family-like transposase [Streptomyces viridochromogenes Tue57]
MKRAFKYRFYPTDAQAAELTRTFGCVRKVYNMALAARTEAWARQERVTYNQTSAMLTTWKRAKYPRFKVKKKSRASAEYTSSAFRFQDGHPTLAKMAAPLDIVRSRPLPDGATPTTVTVVRDSAGRWYVSLLCEDPHVKPLPAHVLHKLTTRLVRENQTLVIEDLTVRNMVKNRSLARAIGDVAWSEFRSMLEYKADWYGRDVVAADRFFPSSKLCSAFGALQPEMPLNVRTWKCGNCGTTHHRDVNAAKNLLAAGLAASVCGAGVRPQRRTPGGQSARKQKTPRREP